MPLGNNNLTVALTLKAVDEMSRVIKSATDSGLRDLQRFAAKTKQLSESLGAFGRASLLQGGIAAAALAGPIKAFADLEETQTSLEVGLLKKSGEASEALAGINALAVKLGTTFPGTTRDVTAAFSTLIKLGIEEKDLLGGIGEASVQLGAVLGVPYATAAEAAVKLKNATGVVNKDMGAFFDTIQRASFLGVNLEQLTDFFSRASTGLNLMKLRGLEAANDVSLLGAMLIRMGISGDRAGTNLSLLLSQFGNRKKITETNAELARFGIQLDIVDQRTGAFKGVRNLFAQLAQLRSLTSFQKTEVFASLFGHGVFELAEINKMIEEGAEGFDTFKKRMEEQADLQQRTALILKDLRAVWDAAYGTFINTTAAFGRAIAPELKAVVDLFGEVSARLDVFLQRHTILAKVIGLGVGGFAVSAIGAGVFALALSGVLKYVSLVSGAAATTYGWLTRLAVISASDRLRYLGIVPQASGLWGGLGQRIGVTYGQLTRWTAETWASARATIFNVAWLKAQATTMGTTVWSTTVRGTTATWAWTTAQWASLQAAVANAGGLRALALVAGRNVVAGLWAAAAAAKGLSLALLANPWTWVALAAIGAVLLIRKYWAPIAGFFRGLFGGIAEGWNEVAERSIVLRAIGTVVWAILTPLRWLYNLIVAIVTPVEDVGQAWEHTGARIGRAIGRWVAMITNLPGQAVAAMFHAGAQIVEALWRGIQSAAPKPVQAMMGIVKRIRDLLPFSPAKEGPLATLHQVRIIETIAETIRPTALVQRVTQTLQAARTAISPQPSAVDAPGVGRLAFAGAGNINITTHITVTGADTSGEGGPKALAQRIVQEQTMQLEKLMRRKYAI